MADKINEYVGVQYLRGFAAMSVVLYHALPSFFPVSASWAGREVLAGGVDIFFVISGFIIHESISKAERRPWEWWRGRLVRIVPMYWFILALALVLEAATGQPLRPIEEVLAAFLFIPHVNSVSGDFTPYFSAGWTLNFEFLFYAIVAFSLLLPKRLRIAMVVGVISSMVLLRVAANPASAIQVRWTSPLMLEFLGGGLISLVLQQRKSLGTHHSIALSAILLSVVSAFVLIPRLAPHGPRFIYFGLPAVFLVLGVVLYERTLSARRVNVLKVIGDSSYSLYLIHPLFLALFGYLFDDVRGWFGFCAFLCILAVGARRWVEQPLLNAFHRK
jgi:exopolysaccharide production protein ExoZ